jgi:TolB-like protein/Tfp pilus assembly protein PilF
VPVPKIESIAVLPLENLSHNPEQEYFADGMTEALITDLGKISALRVISRTSVMQYKGTKKPLPEIARELNVDAVLEGTVTRSGDRVRVTANLLHAPTDRHLWAETYESDLGDVLTLQGEVARAIAEQVRIKLTPEEQARFAPAHSVNPEAHDAYLKGRYYWNLRTESGLKKSIDYFQQAIKKDPGYARAYAGLADSYAVSVMWGFAPPREAYPRAKAAALKALEMDGTLAEPHASLGVAKVDFDFDFVGAEKEYKLAIKLNPSYATAHEWYATYLALMGRHNEAFPEIKRAQELDPLSPTISVMSAPLLLWSRRYDEAIAESRRTLELYPGFYPAHMYLGSAYEQKKLYDQAIAEYQKALALEPGNSILGTALACGYAAAGKRSEALKRISQLKEHSRRMYVSPYGIACIYAALGHVDQACAWLEKAYEDRSYGLYSLKTNPRFDPLRSDPRFQALLRRMNFP